MSSAMSFFVRWSIMVMCVHWEGGGEGRVLLQFAFRRGGGGPLPPGLPPPPLDPQPPCPLAPILVRIRALGTFFVWANFFFSCAFAVALFGHSTRITSLLSVPCRPPPPQM